jgi:hypothetical protein
MLEQDFYNPALNLLPKALFPARKIFQTLAFDVAIGLPSD